MKLKLLLFFIYFVLCNYLFSLDLNTMINYLGNNTSIIKRDFPEIVASNDIYTLRFNDDGKEYLIRFLVFNNRIYGFEYTIYVNNYYKAKELFNKMKVENVVPLEGRIVADTIGEYKWILSDRIISQTVIINDEDKYGVMMLFLTTMFW